MTTITSLMEIDSVELTEEIQSLLVEYWDSIGANYSINNSSPEYYS